MRMVMVIMLMMMMITMRSNGHFIPCLDSEILFPFASLRENLTTTQTFGHKQRWWSWYQSWSSWRLCWQSLQFLSIWPGSPPINHVSPLDGIIQLPGDSRHPLPWSANSIYGGKSCGWLYCCAVSLHFLCLFVLSPDQLIQYKGLQQLVIGI